MKKSLIRILTLILILSSVSTAFSQKYFDTNEYMNALQNIKTIDPIEGIWTVREKQEYKIGNDEPIIIFNKIIDVGILSEGNLFQIYNIENGYFKDKFRFSIGTWQLKKLSFNAFTRKYEIECYDLYDEKTIILQIDFTSNKLKFSYTGDGYSILWELQKKFPISQDKKTESGGTGFAISNKGFIVTNYHVIEGAKSIKIRGINGDFNILYNAKVIVEDRNNDLAILKLIEPSVTISGIIPFTLKTSSSSVGESIFVLGYPLTSSMGEEIKVTNGIVSSKSGFQGDITSYQVSAPIQPGNSGAPLFDSSGNLIGIINSKHSGTENVGYAIKTSYLKNLIDASPENIFMPKTNSLIEKKLTEQVELIKKYVYIIEINSMH